MQRSTRTHSSLLALALAAAHAALGQRQLSRSDSLPYDARREALRQAIRHLERASTLEPMRVRINLKLAIAYTCEGPLKRARLQLELQLGLWPNSARVHCHYGLFVSDLLGARGDGERLLRRALLLAPDSAWVKHCLLHHRPQSGVARKPTNEERRALRTERHARKNGLWFRGGKPDPRPAMPAHWPFCDRRLSRKFCAPLPLHDSTDDADEPAQVCVHILEQSRPVRYVVRDERGFHFRCAHKHETSPVFPVALTHLSQRDPSLSELLDLRVGWTAGRPAVGKPWRLRRASAT
jgi:hypothetical protein